MGNLYKILLTSMLLPAALSCVKDIVEIDRGVNLTDDGLGAAASFNVRCLNCPDNTVAITMTEGDGFTLEEIYAVANKPMHCRQSVLLQADASLVEEYSLLTGVEYKALPEIFYNFSDGGVLDFQKGDMKSGSKFLRIYAVNRLGNVLEAGRYLLPIVAVSPWQDIKDDVIYIDVTVRESFTGDEELYTGEDMFMVFYLNTSQFDPRLVTDFYMEKSSPAGREWYAAIGNILNIRKTAVDYDGVSGRVRLNLSTDMRYVLENYGTYILPIKETGRKVCLCIEGGGKGLGFCNLSDSQIEDLVSQTVRIVELYNLDGVNLWDRNSNYDLAAENGLPEMNTTSYPKFIKALREALGSYKLLTLTDYKEPTEYFWDTGATGGVEVGHYLDYAWSGYNDNTDPGIQVVDPYHQGEPGVSALYPRKPIAGLNPKRYGCTNAYWHPGQQDEPYVDLKEWERRGLRQNSIFVFEDIRSLMQDKYEGGTWNPEIFMCRLVEVNEPGSSYWINPAKLSGSATGYNKWAKDW